MSKIHNTIVIGAGPAGWTSAIYLSRANLEPLIFEGSLDGKNIPGGQLMTTTEVENFPGFPLGVQGWDLVEKMKEQALHFGATLISETITDIKVCNSIYKLASNSGKEYLTKTVIIATGASAKYLGLDSEKLFLNKGISACATCDGALPRFRNKCIVVIGGGDTAMEEALFLSKFASEVKIIHRRDAFRASEIMVNRVLNNHKINIEWNSTVEKFIGNEESGLSGVIITKDLGHSIITKNIICSGAFIAIGHQPNSELVKDLVDLENDYIITENGTNTRSKGIFACGDVQDHTYRQAITAAGSGCQAAIDCTRYLEMFQ